MAAHNNAHEDSVEATRLLADEPTNTNSAVSYGTPGPTGADMEEQAQPCGLQNEGFRGRFARIFPALCIGVFLSAADQTIVVSIYGTIGTKLNALNKTSWIATAYFLTLTAFQPLYGKMSDIFGRKACLLFSYTVFGLGCLASGIAQNIDQLIISRALAGIGGGGLTTVVSILMSDVIALRDRGKWQGYMNVISSSGVAFGGPVGGFLADSIGWRWAFLMQVPLCLLAFIAVSLALDMPNQDHAQSQLTTKLRRIDFLGALTLLAAVSLLLLALDRGSNVSWTIPITYVPLIISPGMFIIFVIIEAKAASEPFAPGHVIFSPNMLACYICNFFMMASWMALLFYVPLFLQVVGGTSAAGAGILMIPGSLAAVLGSLAVGSYMHRTGKYYWITGISLSVAILGTAVVSLCCGIAITSITGTIVGLSIAGFFIGGAVTTTLISLIANAGPEDQAIATACSYLFRSLGSVLGISLCASVANEALRNSLASKLPALGLPPEDAYELADTVRKSLDLLRRLSPEVRSVVLDCYAESTETAFGLAVGFISCAFLAGWFTREKALDE